MQQQDSTAITRHDLERRRSALLDLQRQLSREEEGFHVLHASMQSFVDRYTALLGPLYLELDALKSQLHCATSLLAAALRKNGIAADTPVAPQPTALPQLPRLPAGAPLPAEPAGGVVELGPPSLKTLYRRAAKRLHPDLAPDERQRAKREQQMMAANQAYANGDRTRLATLLLAAGEDPVRVHGGDADALRHWLGRAETAVQGRLRVVRAHRALLEAHPMHALGTAVAAAEQRGLDALDVMARRLRTQLSEHRQALYIGQHVRADSPLAQDFLSRCYAPQQQAPSSLKNAA